MGFFRPAPAHIKCPICGRSDVRFAVRREFWDYFHKFFGRVPFRCLSCQARFYAVAGGRPEKGEIKT